MRIMVKVELDVDLEGARADIDEICESADEFSYASMSSSKDPAAVGPNSLAQRK